MPEKDLKDLGKPLELNKPKTEGQLFLEKPRAELKRQALVVEIEIAAKRKPESYTREVQCDILVPNNNQQD